MNAEVELDSFIGKFAAPNQALIRSLRAALQARLPAANELVYDNYNFFVIGYCPSERPSDCIVFARRFGQGRKPVVLPGCRPRRSGRHPAG